MTDPRRIDAATARRLAVEAGVDTKTIQKAFRGETIRGMPGDRARRVLVAAGLLTPGERGIDGSGSGPGSMGEPTC